jgi:hypothetical protein
VHPRETPVRPDAGHSFSLSRRGGHLELAGRRDRCSDNAFGGEWIRPDFPEAPTLRGQSYGTSTEVAGRGARACAPGVGARFRTCVAVGSNGSGGIEAWMQPGDVARWVREYERDHGQRPGPPTSEQERLEELERENAELRRANEIRRKASAYFAQAELDRRPK